MRRIHIILLMTCPLAVALALLIMYAVSPLNKEMYRAGFERNFVPGNPITLKAELDMKVNSFYIAGTGFDKVYLANYTAPFHMEILNTTLTDTLHAQIKLAGIDSIISPGRFRAAVDSPYFFLLHGVMPEILRGNISTWKAVHFVPKNRHYFVEALSISPTSFILRSHNAYYKGYQLAKKTVVDTPYFKFNHSLLEKQGKDGLFSVEGKLHYSKELQKIIYLYSYRNQYIVTDTNLNLSYRGNTIDTFRTVRIKVVNTGSSSILASPPAIINSRSCIAKKYLFIQSNLLAQNENKESFLQSSVIDMYNIESGTYVKSFYVPNYKGNRFVDFRIIGHSLVALYDRYLVTYDLKDNIFTTR